MNGLLRGMIHSHLTWVDKVVANAKIDPDAFKNVITAKEIPKLNRGVILVEMYSDPDEIYIWVIFESFETSKWYVMAHLVKRPAHDWIGTIKELVKKYHTDYVWVTQRSLYAALKLARIYPQLMGHEVT